MRVAIVGAGLLLLATNAYAQSPCAPQEAAYDPYKPSHLAVVREYGGTVLAQAPLTALLKLDPYVPSEAELLRQLGRGIPLWPAYPWHPYVAAPAVADCVSRPEAESSESSPPTPLTSFADVVTALRSAPGPAALPASTPVVRNTEAEKKTGVWIQYAGRTWFSAGAAEPFREAEFVRVGDIAGFPVYRRSRVKEDRIFVPTTGGMVAPFRGSR